MSSGSWSGGAGADILDLDRYMRPRDSNPHRVSNNTNGTTLVVDSGGPGMMRPEECNSMSSVTAEMVKRYSHDSGVSDDSPRPARVRTERNNHIHKPTRHGRSQSSDDYQRPHRRPYKRQSRENRDTASSREDEPSLRVFRAECEKALREHKEQLQRVADICERLTCNQIASAGNSQTAPKKHQQPRASTLPVSTMSSTSGSSSDEYSEQHQKNECKTYKIIMNKLDELNRLFKTRAVQPTELHKAAIPPNATSDTVTVSDKIVATDSPPIARSGKLSPNKNVTEVSINAREKWALPVDFSGDEYVDETVGGTTKYPFNLEDPVQLYSQAKQLQINRDNQSKAAKEKGEEQCDRRIETMCAMCRRYWNYLKEVYERYWKD